MAQEGEMGMTKRTWGEECRTTLVCIDSWEDNVPAGRFYNPCLPEGQAFRSLVQFLQEMEQILDQMAFPKAFTETRSFSASPEPLPPVPAPGCRTGRLATFALRILFRQNGSWQGSVTWLEGKREERFRSTLELVLLVSDALSYQEVS